MAVLKKGKPFVRSEPKPPPDFMDDEEFAKLIKGFEKTDYLTLPKELLEYRPRRMLSFTAIALYMYLQYFAYKKSTIQISRLRLAKLMRIAPRTVSKFARELRGVGAIEIEEHGGGMSTYKLNASELMRMAKKKKFKVLTHVGHPQ